MLDPRVKETKGGSICVSSEEEGDIGLQLMLSRGSDDLRRDRFREVQDRERRGGGELADVGHPSSSTVPAASPGRGRTSAATSFSSDV